jgi:hypothetical protein
VLLKHAVDGGTEDKMSLGQLAETLATQDRAAIEN